MNGNPRHPGHALADTHPIVMSRRALLASLAAGGAVLAVGIGDKVRAATGPAGFMPEPAIADDIRDQFLA